MLLWLYLDTLFLNHSASIFFVIVVSLFSTIRKVTGVS